MYDFWKEIKYFTLAEVNPEGVPEDQVKMNKELMLGIDSCRATLGNPYRVLVNRGFAIPANNNHSDNSYHYKGEALDIVVCKRINGVYHFLPVIQQAVLIYKHTGFTIGMYPHWKRTINGKKVLTGGLHVDVRGDRICWWKDREDIANKKLQYHYYDYMNFGIALTYMANYIVTKRLYIGKER